MPGCCWGGIYSTRKELSRAITAYEKALSIDPEQEDARLLLGTLYLEDHRFELAVKVLTPLVKSQPELVPAHYYLGQAQVGLKRYAAAEKSFQQVLKLSPRFQGGPVRTGTAV